MISSVVFSKGGVVVSSAGGVVVSTVGVVFSVSGRLETLSVHPVKHIPIHTTIKIQIINDVNLFIMCCLHSLIFIVTN